MGWTWGHHTALLTLYPSLADSPVLLEQWPGFAEAVAEMKASGALPADSSAGTESAKAKPKKKKK